jgi:hypothetical protein
MASRTARVPLAEHDLIMLSGAETSRSPPCPELEERPTMAKAKSTMAADEGYCVKCKAKRKISNAQQVKMANGRPALKGVCPVCGTGMFKILPPAAAK